MKFLNAPAAIACSAVVFALIGPGQAQQQQQQQQQQPFQLAFCNTSAYSNVLVALVHRKDAQNWTVDGWYPIPDYGCTVVGSFQRDKIYYYAYGETNDDRIVTWSAPDDDQTATPQCIDQNKFFRSNAGNPSCPAGQESARFRMIKVAPNLPRITWTLSGG
jgi:uncharacterized membrane protein